MRSYPIWNKVKACIYKSSKDWGAKTESSVQVCVGTSAENSHDFVKHRTTCRLQKDGSREFKFFVDGECIKHATVSKAGEYQEIPKENWYSAQGIVKPKPSMPDWNPRAIDISQWTCETTEAENPYKKLIGKVDISIVSED